MAESSQLPYLLRATKGEVLDRPPVWMMRQAGRYMKSYRDLREKYPSFRERSENVDIAVEISLQPFHAFKPDGVILFSDILTPLPAIGIDFDIVESKGPIIDPPIRTQSQIDQLHPIEPEESLPFIREILQILKREVKNEAAILGFIGAPWTLAAYAIEGKSCKDYTFIKRMAFCEPEMLHQFLGKLADAIAVYARYQINSGAQVIQMFDSWAGQLSPQDYETFALPYQKRVVQQVKATHPNTPFILYINGSAGLLERMPQTGVDIVSVDWTVDIGEARQRLGKNIGIQGNIDPGVLFGSKEFIKSRILETIRKAGNQGHILNLGHGVLQKTPEENVEFFFKTAKEVSNLLAVTA
ncbi:MULTISPECIES: uroporphyrinogen decarboxylase [Okeania]|uniref:Uroporphyrinogen decarboxylase n=1 Tax=Okeania hirsuta TaxID=1458930 RepID=A0A3N6PAQ8_9CYAN|nr:MULTISPECIES: uroporphyrinogen decarboxylase [Okeania]NES74411.1 uroporphyrinogen decarboxylase [Okeania sp. SIO1H4]NES88803.1 uroporphyrinogen decarboxylase [Okeania sp. SIO2B9]NET18186.1 uroporphyrinogen decarboxylase [Okeania sp. SIO1H5]NET77445.1 uroporphyrinogen decarboxylase [Okeania sp. SIO1F9]NET92372.1 uroporphyrinogen decarboxylase [Okeania sp. SIO1H2]